MGAFDKSICDCCVCPMQCILEDLIGVENLNIETPVSNIPTIITGVKDFIVSTNNGEFPICQITHVCIEDPSNTITTRIISALKPKKNSRGKCACCEDPMTNLLKFKIGNTFRIELIAAQVSFTDQILGVGEGVVVGAAPPFLDIFLTCSITRITPLTQQKINDPSRTSKRTTPPPAT
ncbi:hypothetical protein [Chengkuizengella sediminis]|uniref:hypothetical protein n=1 Tax=Chengkuizengella sediminis TaxID=1885917 RepID=UPI001389D417|nr:hypothetical protein [Chengkuizengella sediminis]NDI34693.1 hypothetical protein [Chengkuizengella sediminis]